VRGKEIKISRRSRKPIAKNAEKIQGAVNPVLGAPFYLNLDSRAFHAEEYGPTGAGKSMILNRLIAAANKGKRKWM
jgi:hypothetical protein